MPENEPEKNLKIQVYDEGNCVYDEGEPGPITLQGDHRAVEFRSLVVTPLVK